MKKRQFIATLLAFIMVMAFATTCASAVSIPSIRPAPDNSTVSIPSIRPDPDTGLPTPSIPEILIPNLVFNVSVNGVIVSGVSVYQGLDGNFRVYSYEDLNRIFPGKFSYITGITPPATGIILDHYLGLFGYTAEVKNNTLCIYTAVTPQTFEVYSNGV